MDHWWWWALHGGCHWHLNRVYVCGMSRRWSCNRWRLVWSADNCWRVSWLAIRRSRNHRRRHWILLIWQRWRAAIHLIWVILLRRHTTVIVVRWWGSLLRVVRLVIVASIVHDWGRLLVVLLVIVLATSVMVHTLPCRQMTTVHHAGVGKTKPTRIVESGWLRLVLGALRRGATG